MSAKVILDMILEQGRVLTFKGPPYRTLRLERTIVDIVPRSLSPELRELTPTSLAGYRDGSRSGVVRSH